MSGIGEIIMLCRLIEEKDIDEISKWNQYEIDLYTPLDELKNMYNCSKADEFNWLVLQLNNDVIADTYFELHDEVLYYSIRLNPEFQNKGYAKKVFFRSLEYLKNNGVSYKVVVAEVCKDNYRAIKFHESLGFRLCSSKDGFLNYKYYMK